jgi:hypothetical protein
MKFPKKQNKKKTGQSRIEEFKSPYLNKQLIPTQKRKRKTKRVSSIKAPSKLTRTNKGGIKKWLIGFFALVLISLAIYAICFSNFFTIRSYQIYEDGTLITNDLELNNILDDKLRNQSLVFVNTQNLTKAITENFPEYEKVEFNKQFPQVLKINLTKYPSVANLVDVVQTKGGPLIQKKYLLNANGIVTTENEENPDLPYISMKTPAIIPIKSQAIAPDKMQYIIQASNLYEEKFGMKVIEAEYLKTEREVHLHTEKFFEVWIDMTKDLVPQIDKLKKAIPKLDIYNTPLEYIDLRISGTDAEKVIFKRRNK